MTRYIHAAFSYRSNKTDGDKIVGRKDSSGRLRQGQKLLKSSDRDFGLKTATCINNIRIKAYFGLFKPVLVSKKSVPGSGDSCRTIDECDSAMSLRDE